MSDDEIIDGIRSLGRFDATVGSAGEAERLVRTALPHAEELPPALHHRPERMCGTSVTPPNRSGQRAAAPEVRGLDRGKETAGRKLGAPVLSARADGGSLTMSVMFEVYYRSPADERREWELTREVVSLGGRL